MSTYDEYQQVFALSCASNMDGKCTGSQSHLQNCIERNLPPKVGKIGPEWSVTWGPVVYQAPYSRGPDNTWYVANNKSMQFADGCYNTYVVAIAGTAITSLHDFREDLGVGQVVDFASWVSGGITKVPQPAPPPFTGRAFAAMGTVSTVVTLLTTNTPSTAYGTGTLYQYLTTLPQTKSTRIVFTGHSLGGALCPTMALAFLQAGQLSVPSVLAYPTAGPTPGNADFATLFQTHFPKMPANGSSYQVWNCNVVNLSDIVPYAWYDLPELLSIYGKLHPVCHWFIKELVTALEDALKPDKLSYSPIQCSPFKSTSAPTSPPKAWEYTRVAIAQHIREYFHLFDIPFFDLPCPCPRQGSEERVGDDAPSPHPIFTALLIEQDKFKASAGLVF